MTRLGSRGVLFHNIETLQEDRTRDGNGRVESKIDYTVLNCTVCIKLVDDETIIDNTNVRKL